MPKYRVLETSYIGNSLCQPGDIVEYDGEASGNLEGPVDEDGNVIVAKPKRGNKAGEPASEPASEPAAEEGEAGLA